MGIWVRSHERIDVCGSIVAVGGALLVSFGYENYRSYGNYGSSGYRSYGYRGGYGNYGYGPRVGVGVGNYGYGRGGVSVNVGGFF